MEKTRFKYLCLGCSIIGQTIAYLDNNIEMVFIVFILTNIALFMEIKGW